MSGASVQKQGTEFEQRFSELLGFLLEKRLGFDLRENAILPPGHQFGKDIHARWVDDEGNEVLWQFECKSQSSKKLSPRDFADKLFDLMRSSHRIDVWCLVLPHVEPSTWVTETVAWANEELDLPFVVQVLSKDRGGIDRLFACEKQLHEQEYGEEPDPPLTDAKRGEIVRSFARFLSSVTSLAREGRSAWQVVTPDRLRGVDDPDRAAGYLRGRRATAPWESVAHGWATWRGSSVDPLVERVLEPDQGFDFAWLVAAAGEGKSTTLRQVAWKIASEQEDWIVLWTEPAMLEGAVEIPSDLIAALGESNVLLCVDGSAGVEGAERLRAITEDLADSGKRVFCLFADRGIDWRRSPLPPVLQRGLAPRERMLDLEPLSADEAADLVQALRDRELLTAAPEVATKSLRRRASGEGEKPWLLPTLMQLTDPEGRGFEGILSSVLAALRREPQSDSLLLLLVASIAQAAGHSLPVTLAERLATGEGGLVKALEALTAELDEQLGSGEGIELTDSPGTLVTHHRVVAEGFLAVAAGSRELRGYFLEACKRMPETIASEMDPEMIIPENRFKLMEASIPLLRTLEPKGAEGAISFLRSLISLDERQFPAMTQLGDCYSDWLSNSGNPERATVLAEEGRAAYRKSLMVAVRVLEEKPPPFPYSNIDVRSQEELVRHAWGVLEDKAGQIDGNSIFLKRAVMLFLQSSDDRALSTLALPLIHLAETKRASLATAAFRARATSAKDHEFVAQQERLLEELGQKVPQVGFETMDVLLPDLTLGLLRDEWREIGLYETKADHDEALVTALRRWAGLLDQHPGIDKVMTLLRKRVARLRGELG